MRFALFAGLTVAAATCSMPVTAGDVFNPNTLAGWQRQTGAALMAYGNLPFHAGPRERKRPHLGLAMTAPVDRAGGRLVLHTQAPRFIDLRLTGTGKADGWTASLSAGAAPVWSSDPAARQLLDGGGTWAAVGLLTVAAGVGIFAITEDEVPPANTTGGTTR
ncbi:MAG: hypothetical protein SFV21_16225 [Rhodospirillaceae bacterium]|nr:hypothetical protein [Rhodospirillaceae bacterium]